MTPVVLIGYGAMGRALATGWRRAGLAAAVRVVSRSGPPGLEPPSRTASWRDLAELRGPATIVIAVKPDDVGAVLDRLKPRLRPDLLIVSVAAGVTLAAIEARLGAPAAVMRAMPNTATAVGAGMSVLIASPAVSDEQRRGCEALFGAVGEVAWFDEERLLDVATAVCGSGPAYVFRFTEALAEAGQAAGLEPALAVRMARATLLGAGALAAQSEPSLAVLRAAVTSPGGTTAAGLAVLDHDAALSDLLAAAVRAAAARSAALADGAGAGPRAHGPPTTLLDPLAQAEGGKPL